MGPECVAQQKKLVSTSTMYGEERRSCPIGIAGSAVAVPPACADTRSSAGERRTRSETGAMTTTTRIATICSTCLQSWEAASQATHGDIVKGATPNPADTSETARLRCVANQPVTQAIIGANIAEVARTTRSPNENWNPMSEVALLASARPAPSRSDPARQVQRAPIRSLRAPQAALPTAMARNPMVMAADMPVVDQPVLAAIGRSSTGSENIAPSAMQPITEPAATITQR